MNSILENWNLLCSRLEQVTQNNNGIIALCPCPSHADKHPSFSASYNHEGISVHCFKGCTFEEIVSSLGMEESQFFAPNEKKLSKKTVAEYRYEDVNGILLYNVLRFSDKTFAQKRADGKWTLDGVKRVPYLSLIHI
mgnify:FL=1